jgi:hypothetical protein
MNVKNGPLISVLGSYITSRQLFKYNFKVNFIAQTGTHERKIQLGTKKWLECGPSKIW